MKLGLMAAALAAALLASPAWADADKAAIAAAIADSSRPAADVARDAARKPAEMAEFAGLKPGDTVLELLPGGGYFTRIFSKIVGPSGKLYVAIPDPKGPDAEPAAAAIASLPGYGNIAVVAIQPLPAMAPLDVVWTSWNYHDLHLSRVHADMAQVDKGWFALLKPGGVVVIVDHVALPGSPGTETADKLHRIDPALIKSEMEGAGFVFDGESDVLRNPNDPHTIIVFDPSIRGKTDQIVYRFKKPN
ncbi:MAG: class I SAM-dependent methyltransferase [Proteobacteria bacterium]|nr:class I SAM-dependent methyltransferase [Pseudomonadota bacterium]